MSASPMCGASNRESPTRGYYPFYPEVPPAPPAYELFFEPQQFWMKDPADGTSAVQFRDYLRISRTAGRRRLIYRQSAAKREL